MTIVRIPNNILCFSSPLGLYSALLCYYEGILDISILSVLYTLPISLWTYTYIIIIYYVLYYDVRLRGEGGACVVPIIYYTRSGLKQIKDYASGQGARCTRAG